MEIKKYPSTFAPSHWYEHRKFLGEKVMFDV